MQKAASISHKHIPLRSPTPPLNSSSEDLNDLEQELQHLDVDNEIKKPHFLDEAIPPPDFSAILLVSSDAKEGALHYGQDDCASLQSTSRKAAKSSCASSGSVSMSYVYEKQKGALPTGIDQPEPYKLKYESPYSLEQMKMKKAKEPSFALSRFLTAKDDLAHKDDAEDNDPVNPKANGIFSFLSIIGSSTSSERATKLLEMSRSPEQCQSLRQHRCIPLLVDMIHLERNETIRNQARQALQNVVNSHADDKSGRRESKVLRYIELIMDFCDLLSQQVHGQLLNVPTDGENHPLQAMSSLMKISYDQDHRHAMCQLGALQTIASLVQFDHAAHSKHSTDKHCLTLHRFAGLALTNLTFGDGNNKALLCGNKHFIKALVAKIHTDNDDLLKANANVIRNLAWRPDNAIKATLKEFGAVTALAVAAMKIYKKPNHNETALRAILSALWNLSAHSSSNKSELCLVDGALAFLVDMLKYEAPSKMLDIVENAGGVLNNVSSHIAVNEDFRLILRQKNCLLILLRQLDSESLTVVGNACGTLWNLSARCPEDQKFLRDNGAVSKLRLLVNSTHTKISQGSLAALKNLDNFQPNEVSRRNLDSVSRMIRLKELPSLDIRKQRAFQQACEAEKLSSRSSCKSVSLSSVSVDVSSKSSRSMPEPRFSYSTAAATPRQTGTIPKRMPIAPSEPAALQWSEQNETTPEKSEPEPDQITNFSLLYDENTQEPKEKADVFVEDSVKCYDVEGTPQTFLSNAGSDENIPAALVQNGGSRTIAQYSGGNTPEKPIYFCEEGTPMYFSHQDSFNSLTEEAEIKDVAEGVSGTPPHGEANDCADRDDQDKCTEDEKTVDTAPISPEGAAAKSVKFNESLETPMMFSRQSSIQSLSSIEPALPDDQGSVVSEIR